MGDVATNFISTLTLNIGSPWLLWDILSSATHALIVHGIHAQQQHPQDPVHIVDTNVGI